MDIGQVKLEIERIDSLLERLDDDENDRHSSYQSIVDACSLRPVHDFSGSLLLTFVSPHDFQSKSLAISEILKFNLETLHNRINDVCNRIEQHCNRLILEVLHQQYYFFQYYCWLYYLYLLLIILGGLGGGKRTHMSLSLVLFLLLLLIISGRIELNPGPTLGEILKLVLRENFHLLSEAIQTCLPDIAKELYAKGFITRASQKTPSSCAIIDQFEIKLNYTEDVVELEKYCQSFLNCLSSQSGPPLDFSRKLAREWTEQVHQELRITLSFEAVKTDGIISQTPSCSKCTCVQTEQVTTSNQVESGHVPFEITLLPDEEAEIIKNLLKLHRRFVKILRELKDELTQAVSQGMIKLPDIIDYIQNDTENDLSSCVTIDDLIRNSNDSFDFLDCTILLEISQELPDLVEKFENHSKEVENFQNSPPVRGLGEKIQLLYKPYFCNSFQHSLIPTTIIYLSKSPGTIVTNRLHTLIKHFLPRNKSHQKTSQLILEEVKFCVNLGITKTLVPASIAAKGELLSLPEQSLMLADHDAFTRD